MDIRERLIQYPALHCEVLAMFDRLNELEQSGREAYSWELDLIERQVSANQEEMNRLMKMIDSLEDPVEQAVLKFRYIYSTGWKPERWRDVCLKLFGGAEEKHIVAAKRIHRKALENLSIRFD